MTAKKERRQVRGYEYTGKTDEREHMVQKSGIAMVLIENLPWYVERAILVIWILDCPPIISVHLRFALTDRIDSR